MENIIQVDPIGKPRMTRSDKWKKRNCVMRYRAFCDTVREHTGGYLEDVSGLSIVFHIPMPKSWSIAKKALAFGKPHTQKPDIDNMCKAFMDAILKDDSCVHKLNASKVWASKGAIIYHMEKAVK